MKEEKIRTHYHGFVVRFGEGSSDLHTEVPQQHTPNSLNLQIGKVLSLVVVIRIQSPKTNTTTSRFAYHASMPSATKSEVRIFLY